MFVEIAQAATEAVGSEATTGVLGTLGINWKIFIAQLVNFGIVLLVLRRFVYLPLLNAMAKRSQTIEQGLADAKKYELALIDLAKTRQKTAAEGRAAARELLDQAEKQAGQLKQEIIVQAEEAGQKLRQQNQEDLKQDKAKMLKEVKAEAAQLITSALEKILKEKIDHKKDEELITNSLDKLKPAHE